LYSAAFTASPTEQRNVVAYKRAGDIDDVASKINYHGQERAQLDDGDGGGCLLSLQRSVGAVK